MSRYFLKRLSIEGFRGINNQGDPLTLDFAPDRMTTIFAANGYGKSSIFDALNYALSGTVPRLEQMQSFENPGEYYNNIFHQGPAAISLIFRADDCGDEVDIHVVRDSSGHRQVTSDSVGNPDDFLKDIRSETLLLDYSAFTNFVNARPIDRGREFIRLIGLGDIATFRGALEAVRDTCERDLNADAVRRSLNSIKGEKARIRTEAISVIGKLCPELDDTAFSSDKVSEVVLHSLTQVPPFAGMIIGKHLAELDFEELQKAVKMSETENDRATLRETLHVLGLLAEPVDVTRLTASLNQVDSLVLQRANLMEEHLRGPAYRDILDGVVHLLDEGTWPDDRCPLCERTWEHPEGKGLRETISAQLTSYSGIDALDDQLRSAWRQCLLDASVKKTLDALNRAGISLPQPFQPLGKGMIPTAEMARDGRLAVIDIEHNRQEAEAQLNCVVEALREKMPESLFVAIERLHDAERLQGLLASLAAADERIKDTGTRLKAIEKWHEFVAKVAEAFSSSEYALTSQTIGQLSNDISEIFQSIMQQPQVDPLLDRQAGKERLLLRLRGFFGQTSVDAIPVFSESYRNALGLSIYLAINRRRTYGGRFLVLDDITSSFDSGHQLLTASTIYDHLALPQRTDGLQVILLSHDGLLGKYFDKVSSEGLHWANLRLMGLPPNGSIWTREANDVRLRADMGDCLSHGDTERALPYIRQYLEFQLLTIIRRLKIRVPLDTAMTADMHVVGNLLNAVRLDIDLHHRAGALILPEPQLNMATAIVPWLLGNWVDHYETGSTALLTVPVLQTCIDKVDELVQQFQYTCNCGKTPATKFYRDLTSKQPGCGAHCH